MLVNSRGEVSGGPVYLNGCQGSPDAAGAEPAAEFMARANSAALTVTGSATSSGRL